MNPCPRCGGTLGSDDICESCGLVYSAPMSASNPDDLRHNPDLDAMFGVPTTSKPPIAPDAIERIGQHAARAAGATAAVGASAGRINDPAMIGVDPTAQGAPPPGGDGPTIELGQDTIERLASAMGGVLGRGAGRSADRAAGGGREGNGYEYRWSNEQSQWMRVPKDSKSREGTGDAEKEGSGIGGKIGKWAGRGLGTAVGAYFGGPAGAAVGGQMGEKVGEKAGEKVGGGLAAPLDRAAGIIKSGDANNTLQRMAPESAQPIINWYRAVDQATQTMINHNRALGEFSAAMGNVMARREATEAFRSKEIGDRLAGSAEYLSNAEQDRKDNTSELVILSQKVDNYAQGLLNKLASIIAWLPGNAAKYVNKQLEKLEGEDGGKALTPYEFLQGMAAEGDRANARAQASRNSLADEMDRANRRMR